jgi:hypothetical protein
MQMSTPFVRFIGTGSKLSRRIQFGWAGAGFTCMDPTLFFWDVQGARLGHSILNYGLP